MIVRIATEGQYELLENDAEALNELDNQAVAACEADDEEQFDSVFAEMINFVRTKGQPVADDILEGSDVIVPPPDSSLAEAKADFTGDGLIPD
ncbi:MAG: PspA-associated protein PspAA [Solirubrobacteraceae bacterium]